MAYSRSFTTAAASENRLTSIGTWLCQGVLPPKPKRVMPLVNVARALNGVFCETPIVAVAGVMATDVSAENVTLTVLSPVTVNRHVLFAAQAEASPMPPEKLAKMLPGVDWPRNFASEPTA